MTWEASVVNGERWLRGAPRHREGPCDDAIQPLCAAAFVAIGWPRRISSRDRQRRCMVFDRMRTPDQIALDVAAVPRKASCAAGLDALGDDRQLERAAEPRITWTMAAGGYWSQAGDEPGRS